jgi:hypothetical protein
MVTHSYAVPKYETSIENLSSYMAVVFNSTQQRDIFDEWVPFSFLHQVRIAVLSLLYPRGFATHYVTI